MADTNLLILAREFKALRNRVQEVLKMPVGPQGLQGDKGEQGVKGETGAPGKNGKDGKDGVNGLNGTNGINGTDGVDGADGLDGVGVQNAYIDFDNSLVIVLTSGQEINAGFLSQETKESVVATFKQGAQTINELLPVQTGNENKVLTTDGTNVFWNTPSGGTETDPVYASSSWYTTTNNSANWDTAYGWGNHASAGYLTSSAIGVSVQAYDADLTTWAGKAAPTGVVVGDTDTQTLTNKNIQERVVVAADATSITINADTTDLSTQANTQAAGTLTVNAPTGTPVNGQKLMLRLQSTNVQTFSWNAVFAGSTDLVLPTASSGSSKYDYVGFIYNSTASKWQIIAKNFGF